MATIVADGDQAIPRGTRRAVGQRLGFVDRRKDANRSGDVIREEAARQNRYSRFVGAMKLILPIVALGMISTIFIWPKLYLEEGRFRVGFLSNLSLDTLENLTLVRARYIGTDKKNRAYMVTAEMANQVSPESDQITLSAPAADITLEDGKWLAMTAKSGEFGQKAQTLLLWGEVSIFHDDGYSFHTETVSVDLKQGSAEGDQPVVGFGPAGRLEAEGFRIIDKGRRVVFTGKSKLVLWPGAADALGGGMKQYTQ